METWKKCDNMISIAEELADMRIKTKQNYSRALSIFLDTITNYYSNKDRNILLEMVALALF